MVFGVERTVVVNFGHTGLWRAYRNRVVAASFLFAPDTVKQDNSVFRFATLIDLG
jgi:hypothetical protein